MELARILFSDDNKFFAKFITNSDNFKDYWKAFKNIKTQFDDYVSKNPPRSDQNIGIEDIFSPSELKKYNDELREPYGISKVVNLIDSPRKVELRKEIGKLREQLDQPRIWITI